MLGLMVFQVVHSNPVKATKIHYIQVKHQSINSVENRVNSVESGRDYFTFIYYYFKHKNRSRSFLPHVEFINRFVLSNIKGAVCLDTMTAQLQLDV
jgi:hypothetical protein